MAAAIPSPLSRTFALAAALGLALAACDNAPDQAIEANPVTSDDMARPPEYADYGPVELKEDGPGPPDAPDPHDCGAPQADAFVGMQADALIRGEIAEAVAPNVAIRYFGPDDTMPEETRPGRLLVLLDANETISEVRCG